MSELDALILERRSIRKYKPDLPPEAWIQAMIACAARAPSPTNSRPIRIIRIKSPEVRQALYQAMNEGRRAFMDAAATGEKPKHKMNVLKAYWRYSEFIANAPLLFSVGTATHVNSFSKRLLAAGIIDQDQRTDIDHDISIGLALKGFLLKAAELGLGACILTAPLVFIGDVDAILGLKNINVRCLVTVGFPDETPHPVAGLPLSEMYLEI